MQYSFNNSRKIPKLAQFIPGIYNNFYYKILGYFWGVTEKAMWESEETMRQQYPQLFNEGNFEDEILLRGGEL